MARHLSGFRRRPWSGVSAVVFGTGAPVERTSERVEHASDELASDGGGGGSTRRHEDCADFEPLRVAERHHQDLVAT